MAKAPDKIPGSNHGVELDLFEASSLKVRLARKDRLILHASLYK